MFEPVHSEYQKYSMQNVNDFYNLYKSEPSFLYKLKRFAKQRGIELTIAIVGLFVGIATVVVSYKVGNHQEILQASRMTDSYFNGIVDLFAKSPDENQRINLLMIARTDAIIEDLHRLNKPDKLASVIIFISTLNPRLFYEVKDAEFPREKYIYLGEINLSGAHLTKLDLQWAALPYTNLKDANLTYTNLQGAILRKTNLENALLDYANFTNANLQGANLKKASISKAVFENANLEGAIWINGIRCKKGSIGQCLH
ncbi:MAG: pentapeptide repeat-containing protein [Proteobacteria bacterium]|nr:pentapeptide repeat-containing protein [Pseudomonadota bacterium]